MGLITMKNHPLGDIFFSLIQSPSQNGFMEPKYLAGEVIVHPNHPVTR